MNGNDAIEQVDGDGHRRPTCLLAAHRGDRVAEEGTDAGLGRVADRSQLVPSECQNILVQNCKTFILNQS